MTYGLEKLIANGFRNLERLELAPSKGFNLIFGENAQGKTSLLETIYLLSNGRILRGSRDSEAIRHGEETCSVDGTLVELGTEIGVELRAGKRKRATLNKLGLPRSSDLIGRLPSVCFWAGDLCLASGTPAERRLFMDSELSQLYPMYLKHFSTYKRSIDQRNALLKVAQERSVASEQFEVWEEAMGPAGAGLRAFREDWVTLVNSKAANAQANLGEGEVLAIDYLRKDDTEDLTQALAQNRQRDIMRGTTTLGPHRDDLEIMVEGRSVRAFGSQGQQRTSVIAIKLAVLDVARDILGAPPVLLLDDIFSDLDAGRRKRLVEIALEQGGQVFLTCTESSQVGKELTDKAKLFEVKSGMVMER